MIQASSMGSVITIHVWVWQSMGCEVRQTWGCRPAFPLIPCVTVAWPTITCCLHPCIARWLLLFWPFLSLSSVQQSEQSFTLQSHYLTPLPQSHSFQLSSREAREVKWPKGRQALPHLYAPPLWPHLLPLSSFLRFFSPVLFLKPRDALPEPQGLSSSCCLERASPKYPSSLFLQGLQVSTHSSPFWRDPP